MRTPLEKKDLERFWPSDANDSTDDELQKDPPEAILNQTSRYKTYTYIEFWSKFPWCCRTSAAWTELFNFYHQRYPHHRPSEQFAETTPNEPIYHQFFKSWPHHRFFITDLIVASSELVSSSFPTGIQNDQQIIWNKTIETRKTKKNIVFDNNSFFQNQTNDNFISMCLINKHE